MTDEFVAEAAQMMGITLHPEWTPEVRAHLETMLRMAETVLAFDLPDAAEPAPMFRA
jgi:hypothetical protein